MSRKVGTEFVVGFIAMSRVDEVVGPSAAAGEEGRGKENVGKENEEAGEGEEEDWLIMTPGVRMGTKGDSLGQQYRTPREVVFESGCDVIIVGRGIHGVKGGEEAIRDEAERYRLEGWNAYEERLRR